MDTRFLKETVLNVINYNHYVYLDLYECMNDRLPAYGESFMSCNGLSMGEIR